VRAVARFVAFALYTGLAAISWTKHGFPGGDRLFVWLLGLLLVVSLAKPGRFVRDMVFDWLPFLVALTLYDLLRGIADGDVLPAHARPQIWIDEHLFGFGTVPSVFLQRHLWDPLHLHWWDYATWLVYMSHFLVTPILAAALWWWAPAIFRRFTVVVVATSAFSMLTYFLYPAVPPWLASQTHLLPSLTRIVGVVSSQVTIIDGRSLYEQGTVWSNQIAAMPSLHEGLAVVAALTLWPLANRWARVLLVVYPLAMGFALVYSGEHYVSELVVGAAYAFGANALASRGAFRWRTYTLKQAKRAPATLVGGEQALERAA
jgi:hypothetical protein